MPDLLSVAGSLALRISVIYVALLALLRIGGRRELAQLTPADMLLLLLLSEAVSPALTGGDDSIASGLFGAALLIALTWLIGWFTFRSRRFGALVEGESIVLVRDGKVDAEQLRRLRITDRQLRTSLHEHGALRMSQVAVAYVEPSGKVTVIKDDEVPSPGPSAEVAEDASEEGGDADDAEAQLAALKQQLAKLERTLRRSSGGRSPRDGAAQRPRASRT